MGFVSSYNAKTTSMALTDDLVFWYTGEDANDSHTGGHTLTPVNSPTHVTGKIGNAFQPELPGNRFWRAAGATFPGPGTNDFSLSFWTQRNPNGGNDGLIGWGAASTNVEGFDIWSNANSNIICYLSDGVTNVAKQFLVSLVASTWAHIVMNFDRSGNLELFKNKVSISTVSISTFASHDLSPTNDFLIGSSDAVGKNDTPIDEVGMWHRLLTTDEIADLHDNELTYADFAGGGGSSIITDAYRYPLGLSL